MDLPEGRTLEMMIVCAFHVGQWRSVGEAGGSTARLRLESHESTRGQSCPFQNIFASPAAHKIKYP